MNKYITMLIGVLVTMLSFSSCTDQDDIDISYNTTVGITAAHLFDSYSPNDEGDFDMASDNWVLNIDFLVYDENGILKGKEHYESESLSKVFEPQIVLAPGKYRAISIASFSKDSNGEKYQYWNIENEDNIASLSITESSSYFPQVFETLGIDTQELVVDNKPLVISADIRPVTSLVTVFMDDRQNLHYGIKGQYSAKCRMAVQYNIRSLSSNSVVRFDTNGEMEYRTKEQASEYNTAISRPHDKLDNQSPAVSVCYRALLPEKNKQFQWQIYNREDELTAEVLKLVGNYPTEGKSDKAMDIESGNQYALSMILDVPQLIFEKTGKEKFNYKEFVKDYIHNYELSLIDNMLDYGYDRMMNWPANTLQSYMFAEPYDYSFGNSGLIAYYPHSPNTHFEQFVTVMYKDASMQNCSRIMLALSLPYEDPDTKERFDQPLSQEFINALVEKLNARYTPYDHQGDIYQWTSGENAKVSDCGIILSVKDPGNAFLRYDLIEHNNNPGGDDDNTDYLSLIFPYEWETFLGQSPDAVTSVLGQNYEFESDTWVYANYNKMIYMLSVAKFFSDNINSIGIILNNPSDEVNNLITEHLRSKFIETSPGHFADSEDFFSQKVTVSFQNGMISYNTF